MEKGYRLEQFLQTGDSVLTNNRNTISGKLAASKCASISAKTALYSILTLDHDNSMAYVTDAEL